MLRLWPEVLEIGLFPGHCWIRRGAHTSRADSGPRLVQQLEALRGLLTGKTRGFARFSFADVFISDSHAQVALLPWQVNLRTQVQMNAYGRACFETKGLCSEGSWSLHAGFRHFGDQGMATAVPDELILRLRDLLAEAKVNIRSVMPASTAIYWHHRPSEQRGVSVLLFSEPGRLTAAVHQNGRLCALDVEPVFDTSGSAASRLEKRVRLRHRSVQQVEVLSGAVQGWEVERLREAFTDAVITPLKRVRWSVA